VAAPVLPVCAVEVASDHVSENCADNVEVIKKEQNNAIEKNIFFLLCDTNNGGRVFFIALHATHKKQIIINRCIFYQAKSSIADFWPMLFNQLLDKYIDREMIGFIFLNR
jgi:hypothetical protein